jgi:hypothetical protein
VRERAWLVAAAGLAVQQGQGVLPSCCGWGCRWLAGNPAALLAARAGRLSQVGDARDTPQKCHFTQGFCILNFSIAGCPRKARQRSKGWLVSKCQSYNFRFCYYRSLSNFTCSKEMSKCLVYRLKQRKKYQSYNIEFTTGTLRIFGELVEKLRRKSVWTPKNAECPCNLWFCPLFNEWSLKEMPGTLCIFGGPDRLST